MLRIAPLTADAAMCDTDKDFIWTERLLLGGGLLNGAGFAAFENLKLGHVVKQEERNVFTRRRCNVCCRRAMFERGLSSG